jgi:hypothetical protein
MMRLRGEIGALRHERAALQSELVRQTGERRTQVSALCAGFARDRAGARRAWSGPTLSERRAAERRQQQSAQARATAEQERLEKEAKARAEQEREQQRLAEEARAEAEQESERQRLAEEARAEGKREEQLPATVKSQPREHDSVKPVVPTRGTPFRGSKKH